MSDTPAIPVDVGRPRHRRADVARGAEVGLAAGVVYGGVTGACCGLPPGLFYIPTVWVISCPLYGLVGGVLGGVTGVIVGDDSCPGAARGRMSCRRRARPASRPSSRASRRPTPTRP
jgi:hypothetical protein